MTLSTPSVFANLALSQYSFLVNLFKVSLKNVKGTRGAKIVQEYQVHTRPERQVAVE